MRFTTIKIAIILVGCQLGAAFALDTTSEEKSCRDLGFKKGTDPYGHCVLELFSRKSTADESPDDKTCKTYGLKQGTQGFAECKMRIDFERKQAADRQREYESKRAEQAARARAYEEERSRRDAIDNVRLLQSLQQSQQPIYTQSPQPTIIQQQPINSNTTCRSTVRGGTSRGGMSGGVIDTTCN
jgi:hypothetical protein